jgi:acyl-CoA synthetase (AMP-forming)/AMP-acid ligase II
MAARQPLTAALKVPRGRTRCGDINYLTLTFAELAAEVLAWQAELTASGVLPADRVLVMVRPGLPLIAASFALFSLGAVPVVIDPGMGLKNFLACVARTQPRVLLGIPLARVISRVYRNTFRSVEIRVPASGSPTGRLRRRRRPLQISNPKSQNVPRSVAADSATYASAASDLAAILFTSGSTGAPKGVCYTHGMFEAQVELIRTTYDIRPGEIDLPLLPLFALFNPALGMTTIVPEIDPGRPASVDPKKIIQAIRQEGVTSSFGSPTLWRKIALHCHAHQITLPTVKRVLCAGAPVPPDLWEVMTSVLPHGMLHSPYGATEALPVSSISAAEVRAGTAAATARGAGTCVGHPLSANRVKIIAPTDAPLASLDHCRELAAGQIGEIIVSGPTVTQTYDGLPAATAAAKIQAAPSGQIQISNLKSEISAAESPEISKHKSEIPATTPAQISNAQVDAAGAVPFQISDLKSQMMTTQEAAEAASCVVIWHRLGDLGYLDGEGRLWFCGRKAEQVETIDGPLYTEQIEPLFNAHPLVRRCALIGLGERGRQRPAVVIEPTDWGLAETSAECRPFARELRLLAQNSPQTEGIKLFYFLKKFPVDVRHNAKIHRLAVARWALTAKGYESNPKR